MHRKEKREEMEEKWKGGRETFRMHAGEVKNGASKQMSS